MILAFLLVPAVAGGVAFLVRADGPRRILLIAGATAHAALTVSAWIRLPTPVLGGWLALDLPGLLFLTITSALFLAAAIYGVGYLIREGSGERRDIKEGFLFANAPEAAFTGCLLFFLSTTTLVTVSHHLGLLWVGIEATTLATAPLIYFHRHHRSLEATWKYLLIGSVGIAIALLGNFFLSTATPGTPMLLEALTAPGIPVHVLWLKAAFLCFLVGYGTKMGLAPLHSWLPDAHTESPSLVSALLSGALLNCAFLGILRALQVCRAAGQEAFARELLVGFGLLSMAFAAIFILLGAYFQSLRIAVVVMATIPAVLAGVGR